jgi:RND superfamily putative drug exporter
VLARLAGFSYRRRWFVLLAWVAIFFGVQALIGSVGNSFSEDASLPDSDSQQALELLQDRFPEFAGVSVDVVVQVPATIDDPDVQAELEAVFSELEDLDGVTGVRSPYGPLGARQVSGDRTVAFATVQLDGGFGETTTEQADAIREVAFGARSDAVRIELAGAAFGERPETGFAELIGIGAAVLILLIAFGSVLAMGLPILTALFGIGIGLASVQLLSNVVSIPDFATQLATMIGIGVGIDYALFIITRYRQGLANGLEPEAAVVAAIDTAGRAVLFAGITVMISLAGMLLIGIGFVGGLGVGAATVVGITMAISVTLLPAILGFVGRKIDALSLPGMKKQAEGGRHGFWYRWSRTLQRNPWPAVVLGTLLLLVMAAPVLSMQLGFSDAGNRPPGDTTREAYDLKQEAFGRGSSAPFLVAAEISGPDDLEALVGMSEEMAEDGGVAFASPPIPNEAGNAAILQVIPETDGEDPATFATLERLRADVVPAAIEGTDIVVHIGGATAITEDFSAKLAERLPVFIGVVLGLSFLLLLVVFRSILVPIKAVILNLLSIGAAYGLVVAVFQWGWISDLGIGGEAPIEPFLPMMMFAILFGLSMDYEVFLLSRIKEEYDRTGDSSTAVADGLSATARVITAAAAIMVTVFGSFVTSDERVIQMFGLGLASAIFIDATVVRMVLVPATMELLGTTNWWFPKWLSWLPVVHVEGTPEESEATTVHDTDDDPDPDAPSEREPVSIG